MKTLNIAEYFMVSGGDACFESCMSDFKKSHDMNSPEEAVVGVLTCITVGSVGCAIPGLLTIMCGTIASGLVGAGIGIYMGSSIGEKILAGIGGAVVGGYLGQIGTQYAVNYR